MNRRSAYPDRSLQANEGFREMDLELEFAENASKHGITEEKIWKVFLDETIKCVISI